MTPFLAFLNIGTFELLLVLVVAVVLFGGDLPDVARKAARVVGRMRAMANDIGRELNRPDLERRMGVDLQDVRDEIRDVEANIRRNDPPPPTPAPPTARLPTTTDGEDASRP